MKNRLLSLALALVLCLGLTTPALAGDTGAVGQKNLMSAHSHSAFVDANGTLWMWGENDNGQLGTGTRVGSSVPVRIMEDVSCVSTAQGATAVIKKDGTLWMWGECSDFLMDYDYERLWGNPAKVPAYIRSVLESAEDLGRVFKTPFQYPTDRISNARSVCLAFGVIAVIKNDGTLWMWGFNGTGAVAPDSDYPVIEAPIKVMDHVTAVSCGAHHMAVIRDDGSLWTRGNNMYGALGIGGVDRKVHTPTKVLDRVTAVNCGGNHTVALKDDGTLWAWGLNNSRQIGIKGRGDYAYVPEHSGPIHIGGDEAFYAQTVPVQVMDGVSAIACGYSHTAALKKDGTLWMWGSNKSGQLAMKRRENLATPVNSMKDVAAVYCGGASTFALKTDGTVWAWGSNEYGNLGNGETASGGVDTPVQVLGLTGPVSDHGEPPPDPADGKFIDVKEDDYFAEPVNWAVEQGITTGTTTTTFSPTQDCTNGQILTFLYRAVEKIEHPDGADMDKAVIWALRKGMLVMGFDRNKPCTRADAVNYIWQALGMEDAPASSFADVPANAVYAKAVDWAVANGITNGTDTVKNTFGPNDTCTRGQIVTFLHRAMG